MSGRTGPYAIKSNLAFYVDAANSKSYPGNGSVWNDMSFNQLNGTLTNSPVYSTTYAGGITFNSASLQLFTFPNVAFTTESFVYDFWIKPASYENSGTGGGGSWPGMLSTVNIVDYAPLPAQSTGVAIGFYGQGPELAYGAVCTGSTANPAKALSNWNNGTGSSSPNLSTSSIYNIIVQRNTGTSHLELYVNGVYYNKVYIPDPNWSMSGSIPLRSSIRSTSSPDSLYPNGTYYSIKIYKDKYFTQNEVTQNYNALKGRFGL